MILIYILLSISIIIGITCIILTLINLKKDEPEVTQVFDNTEKIKIILSKDSIENIDNLVDEIIRRSADRYMILKVNYKEKEAQYITEKDADELTKYIYGSIKLDMTDTMRDTIGLVHNISTEKQFDDFFNLRIKLYVLALIVKNNQTIND